MRAGRLDRMITLQRAVNITSEDGQPIEAWSTLGPARRPASLAPLRGDERFANPQLVALEQVEFRIHYSTVVQDLGPLDRVIYPALSEAESGNSPVFDSISDRRIYEIIAVHEIGRREGLQIMAARRTDVTS